MKLGILPQDIGKAFIKNCSGTLTIRKAINEVLHDWFRGQNSSEEAYTTLREALKHPDVGLNLIATETFDSPTTKTYVKPKRKSSLKQSTFGIISGKEITIVNPINTYVNETANVLATRLSNQMTS